MFLVIRNSATDSLGNHKMQITAVLSRCFSSSQKLVEVFMLNSWTFLKNSTPAPFPPTANQQTLRHYRIISNCTQNKYLTSVPPDIHSIPAYSQALKYQIGLKTSTWLQPTPSHTQHTSKLSSSIISNWTQK